MAYMSWYPLIPADNADSQVSLQLSCCLGNQSKSAGKGRQEIHLNSPPIFKLYHYSLCLIRFIISPLTPKDFLNTFENKCFKITLNYGMDRSFPGTHNAVYSK